MNARLGMLALLGVGSSASAQSAVLKSFQWKTNRDSVRMEFGFSEGARPKYRIRSCPEALEKPCLHVEFSGVSMDVAGFEKRPDWIRLVPLSDSTILDFKVALTQPTPWRFSWEGTSLCVDILDRTEKRPTWKNPWMIGGIGASLVAGGLAIWLTSDAPVGSVPSSNIIPPPDIEVPK